MNKLTIRKTIHFQVYDGDEPLDIETARGMGDHEMDDEARLFLVSANGDQEAMGAYYEITRRPQLFTHCADIAREIKEYFKDEEINTTASGVELIGKWRDGQRYVIRIEPVEVEK